ncbi:RAMP superfamily CRISPR-associated protein [Methanomethylovorans sp.]|uniref:RAMP superfamily CRISPR-associated protein n=1 Tax=Methanomethylovorans sp. TaxID=2758717 RepID=UPI00345EAE94
MFERLDNRVIVNYEVVTRSDLHIGGHTTTEPADVDNPVIKNADSYPIIPGSSLKGVLRTEMERLLRGLNLDIKVCDIFISGKGRGGCNVCPVCKLFGGNELASSIRIKDATANSKRTMLRDGVAIDRKKRKAKDGGKYDIEVVPKGTLFTGTCTIENTKLGIYDHAKLGAFLSLLDFFNECSGSIGHASSRGFGEVKITVTDINLITAQDYLDGRYTGTNYAPGSPEYNELKDDAINDWSGYIKSGEYD